MKPSDLPLDQTLLALSDPTRRAILSRLAEGEATVLELGAPFSLSQPAISRHIKVLLKAGLIEQRVDGTKRPCRLSQGSLPELEAYLDHLASGLERNYARLDQLLAETATSEPKEKGTHHAPTRAVDRRRSLRRRKEDIQGPTRSRLPRSSRS